MTRPLILATAAVLTLIAAAPEARADYDDEHERAWKSTRLEGAVGALVGSQRVGYVAGSAGGMHFDGGVRMDKLLVYLEYDFLGVGQSSYDTPDPVRGFMHRVGTNARYSVVAFGGNDIPVRGDIWLEAGLGREVVEWHEGGRLSRNDFAFGMGAQATFRIGRERPRFVGFYYAMKGWVAQSPERKDDMPTCAGPCDTATGPSPNDFGIMFNFGVPFGKGRK